MAQIKHATVEGLKQIPHLVLAIARAFLHNPRVRRAHAERAKGLWIPDAIRTLRHLGVS